MVENKFTLLYDSLRDAIRPILEEQESKRIGILVEDVLKEADRLGIETYESDIEPLLNGLSTYFRDLGIHAEKSDTISGEMVISFKMASEEEIKFSMYLDIYKVLGDILENYRQKLPYVIPESKFPGEYKILEENFEEILASKKPFVIYTNDFLKYVDTLMPKGLKESTKPEFFLEGLQWYLDEIGMSMEISPLISMEKGDLIIDVLVFQRS